MLIKNDEIYAPLVPVPLRAGRSGLLLRKYTLSNCTENPFLLKKVDRTSLEEGPQHCSFHMGPATRSDPALKCELDAIMILRLQANDDNVILHRWSPIRDFLGWGSSAISPIATRNYSPPPIQRMRVTCSVGKAIQCASNYAGIQYHITQLMTAMLISHRGPPSLPEDGTNTPSVSNPLN